MSTVIISVSNKNNIVTFAQKLQNLRWDIIASDGTAKLLKTNCISCKEISDVTNFPELLDGRVKTLNPKIYCGILAIRSNLKHIEQLKLYNIKTIDMVVVDLYPFEQTMMEIPKSNKKSINKKIIENIDIGGVSLLRAAAKNFNDVLVVCDINDYEIVIDKLANHSISKEFKLELAAKAFRYIAYYDSLISNYLTNDEDRFYNYVTIPLKKQSNLRYGENPHQKAAIYYNNNANDVNQNKSSILTAQKLHGKELSYNNYLDLNVAWNLVNEFENPACVIIKHNNPCGCAESFNIKDAYIKALNCDTISAFGGILAFNRCINEETATEINKLFVECIIATDYSKESLAILRQKHNIRILLQKKLFNSKTNSLEYKPVTNGMLIQNNDNQLFSEMNVVTDRIPTKEEKNSLLFAWKVAKFVKSNAIVLVQDKQTIGIGAGQMSRIDSLKIAIEKMKLLKYKLNKEEFPIVLASDAFFPFSDVVNEASNIGVTAIMQPGGSINDIESIKMANSKNITMITTNMRHFKH
ncbi:MAG: bifunctional phosphoribosylaminoimidazolecarboxamide formyltransferase/IMP cyclohydrolase [Endomicrobium sp.]|jgi:phosphoribosylaminoimidazolecarboxamide formyltransferase/IMP cyclohydrolase|nr:bifunctional phosphoribosylaminoimidazolecarboxamide formyltransferase/IMP cyclohydrolase [Endomicrobium sp.]